MLGLRCIAVRAVLNHIVAAGRRAGCSNFIFLLCLTELVALRRNNNLGTAEFSAAIGTVNYGIIGTVLRAGRCNNVLLNGLSRCMSMPLSINRRCFCNLRGIKLKEILERALCIPINKNMIWIILASRILRSCNSASARNLNLKVRQTVTVVIKRYLYKFNPLCIQCSRLADRVGLEVEQRVAAGLAGRPTDECVIVIRRVRRRRNLSAFYNCLIGRLLICLAMTVQFELNRVAVRPLRIQRDRSGDRSLRKVECILA